MNRARLAGLIAVVFVPCVAWPQGNPLGPEFRVNTYTTANQEFSDVAADPVGNFVVVWMSSFDIFGQRYNMIVPVELMHFRVE